MSVSLPAIHVSADELAARRAATAAQLREQQLSAILLFRQESMHYLTGYDTFGYCFFQCLYFSADGEMTLLTRAPDLRQARHTSVIEDIRVWVDGADANPAVPLRAILEQHRCAGERLGIEFDATGLNAFHWRRVEAALDGFCELIDASNLVNQQRLVKSPAELEHIRRAAALADDALDAACELAVPGAFEGDILAAMQSAVFRGGGDYPGNEFIIGSGDGALLCRYFSGRRHLGERDQLTLEFAGVYRRYHACLMRTLLTGEPHPQHQHMHAACVTALQAASDALRPGEPIGKAFDAHAAALDAAGYREARLNACGYSLGTVYAPCWMDWPMLYNGNPVLAQTNMVFFLHMILMDSDAGRAMTLGHTVRIGDNGCEPLHRSSLALVANA